MADFEDYQFSKNDDVTSAAFQLIAALATPLNKPSADIVADGTYEKYGLEWSADMVFQVISAAEAELEKAGIKSCNPYFTTDSDDKVTPCYLDQKQDRCCKSECPFKEEKCENF